MANLHTNRMIESSIQIIIKKLIKLANQGKIPFIFSWQTFGSIKKFGTEHVKDWFSNTLEIDDLEDELLRAFAKDKLCLGKGEGQFDVDVSNVVRGLVDVESLPKLLRPLKYTNFKQDKSYLRNLIINEAKAKGLSGNKVCFGPEWEPNWWPAEIWPWHKVSNFDKLKSAEWTTDGMPDCPSVVMKRVLKYRFDALNIPSETHVKDSWYAEDNEERKRALKRRGITDVRTPQRGIEEDEGANEEGAHNNDGRTNDGGSTDDGNIDGVHNLGGATDDGTGDGGTTYDGTGGGGTASDGTGDGVHNMSGTNLGGANPTFEDEFNDRPTYGAGGENDESVDSLSNSLNDFLDKQPTIQRSRRWTQFNNNRRINPENPTTTTSPTLSTASTTGPGDASPALSIRSENEYNNIGNIPRSSTFIETLHRGRSSEHVSSKPNSPNPFRPNPSSPNPSTPSNPSSPNPDRPTSPGPSNLRNESVKLIEVPQNMLKKFIDASHYNSIKVIETLGLLCGTRGEDNVDVLTHLIIPEQTGHSSGCNTVDVEGDKDYFTVMNRLNIEMLAIIHTHPGNTQSFMSSTDLHQLAVMQASAPNAVSFVYSPMYMTCPAYTVTPLGMQVLDECPEKSSNSLHTHDPHESQNLYRPATNIQYVSGDMKLIDLRSSSRYVRPGSVTRQMSQNAEKQNHKRRTYNRK